MRPDRLRELVKEVQQIQPPHLPRTPSSQILPLQLREKVPQCAQQCLETYIQQEFNCPCNGLAALCQRYSSRGYTLGELAYICLHEYCGRATRKESFEEYGICDSVRGAVQATYSVLTIPATRPAKSRASATTKTKSSLHSTSKNAKANSGQSTRTSPAAIGPDTPTAVSPSGRPPSTGTSAADSSPSSAHSNQLSTTAAVGIVVGVLAVTVLIIAAMYFFFCVRRRKMKDRTGEKTSPSTSRGLPRPSSKLTIRPAENERPIARDTLQCWQQLANPAYDRSLNRSSVLPNPNRTHGNSRSSTRTLPSPRAPVQGRGVSTATAMTIFEEEGENDEDVPPVPAPAWKSLGLPPNPRAKHHSPPMVSPPPQSSSESSPPQHARALSESKAKPTQQPPPSTSTSEPVIIPKPRKVPPPLKIPGSAQKAPTLRVPSPVAAPPFLGSKESLNPSERRSSSDSRSRSRDSSGSLLNYYASSEAGIITPSMADFPAYVEPEIPQRQTKSPQTERAEALPSKLIIKRSSGGSDNTSFESMDFDEPTPPLEEDKRLTPVQESPASTEMLRTPPISDIRYPQIPRSANDKSPVEKPSFANFHFSPTTPKQWHGSERTLSPHHRDRQDWPLPTKTPPDRPIHIKPALSGSTLAAKRRGDTAAHDLELNLNKFGTTYNGAYVPDFSRPGVRNDSPLKGYEQSSARHKHPEPSPQWPERKSSHRYAAQDSPRWEPKLTPQRRGDDLFLQVGIATPLSATFPPERVGRR